MSKFVAFLKDDAGVSAIEYALIAGTTALVLVAVLPMMEASLNSQYTSVATGMQ